MAATVELSEQQIRGAVSVDKSWIGLSSNVPRRSDGNAGGRVADATTIPAAAEVAAGVLRGTKATSA